MKTRLSLVFCSLFLFLAGFIFGVWGQSASLAQSLDFVPEDYEYVEVASSTPAQVLFEYSTVDDVVVDQASAIDLLTQRISVLESIVFKR